MIDLTCAHGVKRFISHVRSWFLPAVLLENIDPFGSPFKRFIKALIMYGLVVPILMSMTGRPCIQ